MVETYDPNVVLSNTDYKVVGTRPIRHDGLDKVTGRAQYGNDINLPGLLHGKLLRSPHAHAFIKSINYKKALAMPGVKAVVTSEDLGQPSDAVADIGEGEIRNIGFLSANCLAHKKALYVGHAIAAVAAVNPHIAEEALALIEVEYEILTPVTTAKDAMKKEAPLLHENLITTTQMAGPGGTGKNEPGSNVGKHFEIKAGDTETGFANADVVIEREFSTLPVHQGYIEPHAAAASWDMQGNLTIWCSSQGHFGIREQTAKILDIPVSKIKVIPMEIGGGFGGKNIVYLEPVTAALSRKTGVPVKIAMNRKEVFIGSGPTSGGTSKVKIGATKEGKLVAADIRLIYEAGAFPGSPVAGGARCVLGPYDIPNAYIEGYDVVVNTPKVAAYRAPGAPFAAFGAEQVIDEICERLGMDPIEFRILNGAQEGTRQVTGPTFGPIGFMDTLTAAKEHNHYGTKLKGPYQGRGVAAGYWGNGGGPASATASVNADGTVSLVEGSPDIGGSRVAMAMQAAEALGIRAEDINPTVGDTDSIGFTSNTAGSGATYKTGIATYEAAQDIKQQMIERAAKIWAITPDDVKYENGVLQHKSDTELQMTFKELAVRLNTTGGPIVGRATTAERRNGPAFAVHIVDVEVDSETGKVTILRYTSVQDAGKAIHPSYVEGQMQGAAVQGIGWALNEGYYFNKDGEMLNSTFLDYRMPTSLDVPQIDTVIVEVPNPGHPYGLRGVAELPLVPPMAAIANAINNAVGRRMTALPMSPETVSKSLSSN
jgi:xanthine dehydrogenase molybdenum-binding subunit